MNTAQRIRGVLAPVVTPFKVDLSPDRERYVARCRWPLSRNCEFAVFGTNSEANFLAAELKQMGFMIPGLIPAGATAAT